MVLERDKLEVGSGGGDPGRVAERRGERAADRDRLRRVRVCGLELRREQRLGVTCGAEGFVFVVIP